MARFAEETAAVERAVDALTKRLENWRLNDAVKYGAYISSFALLSYGLDELIPKMRITLPLRLWRYSLFWMPNRHKDKPLGERLRLALQELGPVWIKFGQMLSTRRDLFPPHIADQLALLQDKVAPFDGKLAKQQIEAAMGGLPVEAWFDDFEIKPLASASIARSYRAIEIEW